MALNPTPNKLARVNNATPPSAITKEEQRLVVALNDKQVRTLDSDGNQFKDIMRYMFAVVGLRAQNFPVGVEKQFLHQFIQNNYGGHTAAEIRLAFDMAIQGLLDLDPRDVKCYENFSIAYFTTIMNAYRKWARDELKRLEPSLPPPMTALELLDKKVTDLYYRFSLINKLPIKWHAGN
jgi:hypothetical protein